MEKELVLDYYEEFDDYDSLRGQTLINKDEDIYFDVYNLDECPEDALIERNLFNADDFVRVLNKGIELAQKGYTKVIIGEVQTEDD